MQPYPKRQISRQEDISCLQMQTSRSLTLGIAYRRTYGEEDYGTWFLYIEESIKDPNYPIIKEQVLKKTLNS